MGEALQLFQFGGEIVCMLFTSFLGGGQHPLAAGFVNFVEFSHEVLFIEHRWVGLLDSLKDVVLFKMSIIEFEKLVAFTWVGAVYEPLRL